MLVKRPAGYRHYVHVCNTYAIPTVNSQWYSAVNKFDQNVACSIIRILMSNGKCKFIVLLKVSGQIFPNQSKCSGSQSICQCWFEFAVGNKTYDYVQWYKFAIFLIYQLYSCANCFHHQLLYKRGFFLRPQVFCGLFFRHLSISGIWELQHNFVSDWR